jgi:hypothetical protein
MSFLKRLLPKRKPVEIKNNVPKEKESIKKTFATYCHAHHGTSDKLCPSCTATLAVVLSRMNRCRYGITKPICDRCEYTQQCFGPRASADFLRIMRSTGGRMFLRHPQMWVKHKFMSWGVDYAQMKREKDAQDKTKAKEKAAKAREKKKES